jgi:hypothetical protein
MGNGSSGMVVSALFAHDAWQENADNGQKGIEMANSHGHLGQRPPGMCFANRS